MILNHYSGDNRKTKTEDEATFFSLSFNRFDGDLPPSFLFIDEQDRVFFHTRKDNFVNLSGFFSDAYRESDDSNNDRLLQC